MKSLKFNLFVFCGHCIVFAVLLGSGVNIGFIVDQWFAPVFGYGSGVGASVAVASGMLVGLGAYGLFIHSEKALKTILRLPDPERLIRGISLVVLNAGFVALGISGLLYRLSFLNSRGVGFLVVIGCVLEVSTPVFGIVMHPLQNPAVEVLEEERMQHFSRRTISDAWNAADRLPTQRRVKALSAGMDEALDEAVENIEAPRIPNRTIGPLSRRMLAAQPSPFVPAHRASK